MGKLRSCCVPIAQNILSGKVVREALCDELCRLINDGFSEALLELVEEILTVDGHWISRC